MVADRGLQQGDLAIVNFSAKRADTGEELPGATRNSMRLDTDDADETFLPGGSAWHALVGRHGAKPRRSCTVLSPPALFDVLAAPGSLMLTGHVSLALSRYCRRCGHHDGHAAGRGEGGAPALPL